MRAPKIARAGDGSGKACFEMKNDYTNFVSELQKTCRRWFCASQLMCCPECGDDHITQEAIPEPDAPLIVANHGFSICVRCRKGHEWKLRLSCWRSEYAEAVEQLKPKAKIWRLEELSEEIRTLKQKLSHLQGKYFHMREELQKRVEA